MNNLRGKPKTRPRVTLIVGIICKDGIVLAADSQITAGTLRTETNKISVIEFLNGKILVAESGDMPLSNRAVHNLRDSAKDCTIEDEETVPMLLQSAMCEARNSQISLYPSGTYTPEHWKAFFLGDSAAELVVGYYHFDKTPYLFSIDLAECIPRKPSRCHFVTSGIGSDLGQHLLIEYSKAEMDLRLGAVVAIHTVETVIKRNPYCNKPTRLGILRSPFILPEFLSGIDTSKFHPFGPPPFKNYKGHVEIYKQEEIEALAKIISKTDEETRADRNSKLLALLSERTEKELQEYMENHYPSLE